MSSKYIIGICLSLSLAGACAHTRQEVAPEAPARAQAEGRPEALTIEKFKWVSETYTPGNSGHVSSEIFVFTHGGATMALVHRSGLEGRSMARGIDGTEIKEGAPLSLPRVEGAGARPECNKEMGELCESFMKGKCLYACDLGLPVKVLDPARLKACIEAGEDPVVNKILLPKNPLHNMALKSPCVFFNGEGLVQSVSNQASLAPGSFHLAYEFYGPGKWTRITTQAVIFSTGGKRVAVLHRKGQTGSMMKQEAVADGAVISMGAKFDSDQGPQEAAALGCTMTAGDGKECRLSGGGPEKGRCVAACSRGLTVQVLDQARLQACLDNELPSAADKLISRNETAMHGLTEKDPCIFYNGGALKLVETVSK